MSRLSIRPRPLDIHKKLPIVKSFKDFEDDNNDTNPPTSSIAANSTPSATTTRNSHLLRLNSSSFDHDSQEVHQVPSKKSASEIPTPQFVVVDTYERDYSQTFDQPTSYLRARGARAELGDFVEYDLDNEDEDWLDEFNRDQKLLPPEKFETLMFKLEVLDHKARERAGLITPTLGSPIPILLQLGVAIEALKDQTTVGYAVFQSVYHYWKEKRERWQKPILRRLQPPPPVNDTNPYNVFRPREKAHRLHTRRMQRRENNVQSFEKLRQVRRNLDQAKSILEALIKREEKKREVMEGEVNLQRIQMKFKHEIELLEDVALPGFPSVSCKFGLSEDEFMDSDDLAPSHPHSQSTAIENQPFTESNLVPVPTASMKQEFRRRHVPHAWLHKLDPLEPVLLFTKPLVPEKLDAAGIVPPSDSSTRNGTIARTHKFHGRIGRGGRIVFDRCNPLMHSSTDSGTSFYLPPKPRTSMYS
ncbi:Enhancer of polycomb-like protein [Citrus sinensis]|uniref:Enhancer of polycomb-like protein n=1 Tax=Citrus sinensis TaxID=2711 RepID=A0ACB8M8Y9_CITSI|nr:Enhancer of polycomb-like protein [Citrus sinensis]